MSEQGAKPEVMSGILGETLVSLKDACGLVPGRKKLGLPTIQRWRRDGVRGVRLETTLVAGRRFTSREAIERFLESVNRAADGEALGRHIDATDPDEAEESDPDEAERDPQPRPSIAKVTAASRKPERPEPIRIPPPQVLPLEDADDDEPVEIAGGLMIEGTLHLIRGPVDFEVEVDRLYWIGFDGVEQESDPLQLLQYIRNLVSEEMPERRAAVVAALRAVIDELRGD